MWVHVCVCKCMCSAHRLSPVFVFLAFYICSRISTALFLLLFHLPPVSYCFFCHPPAALKNSSLDRNYWSYWPGSSEEEPTLKSFYRIKLIIVISPDSAPLLLVFNNETHSAEPKITAGTTRGHCESQQQCLCADTGNTYGRLPAYIDWRLLDHVCWVGFHRRGWTQSRHCRLEPVCMYQHQPETDRKHTQNGSLFQS